MKTIFFLFPLSYVWCFLILTVSCAGQTDKLSSNKPLANKPIAEYVVCVFEDSRGHLWFGTMSKGVARYDGKQLQYFTTADGMCGNTVSSITEDVFGNIWFGSHTGICYYDVSTGEQPSPIKSIWRTSGLHDQGSGWASIKSNNDGMMWASSSEGVFRYNTADHPEPDSTSFIKFNVPLAKEGTSSYAITPGRISYHLKDRNGHLWFCADGYGAIKYDPTASPENGEKPFSYLTKKDGLCSNNITSIVEDSQGRIWFSCIQSYQPHMTGDGGVCRYDPSVSGEGRFTHFTDIEGIHDRDIYTVYKDKRGTIWIGASGYGLYSYRDERFSLIKETNRMDLTSRFGIQDALEDRQNRLWFGFSGGLFRLQDEKIIHIAQSGPWE